jgi:hypothetical protein
VHFRFVVADIGEVDSGVVDRRGRRYDRVAVVGRLLEGLVVSLGLYHYALVQYFFALCSLFGWLGLVLGLGWGRVVDFGLLGLFLWRFGAIVVFE